MVLFFTEQAHLCVARPAKLLYRTRPLALFHQQPISPYLSHAPPLFLVFFYSLGDRLSRVRDYCVRRVTTILRNRYEDVVGTL